MKPQTATRPPATVTTLATLAMVGACALATALASTPAQAHHAFAAEFDADKPVEVRGTVTKVKWVNPHSWIYLDVKNPDGSITNWGFEFGAPNALENRGLAKKDVKAGEEVLVQGFHSKNGSPNGYSVYVTLSDGRKVQTGGAQDAPTPAPADNAAK